MISYIAPLPAGNAVQLLFAPQQGAAQWRLLRNTTGTFSAYNDPASACIYRGDGKAFTDVAALVNGTTYYYCLFELVNGTWQATPVMQAIPSATYGDASNDVQLVLRERLELGLANEVQRKRLVHADGRVPVLTAPPVFEDTTFPVVSVHLSTEGSDERFIGELIEPDTFIPGNFDGSQTYNGCNEFSGGAWLESEGYLAGVSITVMSWCLNADERIALRRALRRIVTANFPVFDSFGFVKVQIAQSDMEDFESYGAPVYQTLMQFSCTAPVRVTDLATDLIESTETTATPL